MNEVEKFRDTIRQEAMFLKIAGTSCPKMSIEKMVDSEDPGVQRFVLAQMTVALEPGIDNWPAIVFRLGGKIHTPPLLGVPAISVLGPRKQKADARLGKPHGLVQFGNETSSILPGAKAYFRDGQLYRTGGRAAFVGADGSKRFVPSRGSQFASEIGDLGAAVFTRAEGRDRAGIPSEIFADIFFDDI